MNAAPVMVQDKKTASSAGDEGIRTVTNVMDTAQSNVNVAQEKVN